MTARESPISSHDTVRSLIGITHPAPPAPSHALTGEEITLEGVRIRGLTLQSGAGIPAFLLEPLTGPTGPRVLAIHQHNYEYHLGKSEAAGLRGNRGMGYALDLARAGCTVLAPDVAGFESRMPSGEDPREDEQRRAWDLIARGSSLMASHLTELRAQLSWLSGIPSATNALGVMGHSMGGTLAFFLTAADERVSAAVSSCGIGTLESFEAARVRHNPSWYVPGLAQKGDAMSIASAVDEQRMYVVSADDDDYFPVNGIRDALSGFRPGRAVSEFFSGDHSLPAESRARSVDWLVEELSRSGLGDRG